ncbi:hypothetical protein [Streptomyces sp. MI02-7b]|uniref:hypothetical protein n=1 Tax=Streptomyces sp. MI02-7b TaxID=462941 RepID=UPI0029A3FD34|nr:hypothetical protein [Streptomyces sp. MI02-7b]MDX3073593.1 hypothetical protein [Streptomyces sp. MI02-7b]
MFADTKAKVIWVLVPVISMGLLAALPFVIATVKGVVRPIVPVVYGAATVVAIAIGLSVDAIAGPGNESPIPGFFLVLLIATAATHTALLDTEYVKFGRK